MERLTHKLENGMISFRGRLPNYNYFADSLVGMDCYTKYCDALYHLSQYEDAEEQGRLIVLPCNVGDTVWFIRPLEQKPKIEQAIVEKIGVRKRGMYLKLSCNSMYETAASSIGKSVFLSREEAEKALEGMK